MSCTTMNKYHIRLSNLLCFLSSAMFVVSTGTVQNAPYLTSTAISRPFTKLQNFRSSKDPSAYPTSQPTAEPSQGPTFYPNIVLTETPAIIFTDASSSSSPTCSPTIFIKSPKKSAKKRVLKKTAIKSKKGSKTKSAKAKVIKIKVKVIKIKVKKSSKAPSSRVKGTKKSKQNKKAKAKKVKSKSSVLPCDRLVQDDIEVEDGIFAYDQLVQDDIEVEDGIFALDRTDIIEHNVIAFANDALHVEVRTQDVSLNSAKQTSRCLYTIVTVFVGSLQFLL